MSQTQASMGSAPPSSDVVPCPRLAEFIAGRCEDEDGQFVMQIVRFPAQDERVAGGKRGFDFPDRHMRSPGDVGGDEEDRRVIISLLTNTETRYLEKNSQFGELPTS